MATAVKRVDESLSIVGSSSKAVMERVAIAVRGLRGYSLARPSPDVAHIAFVNKKLLGSTTHVCTVTLASGPRGMNVSIQGEIEMSRLDQLRAAVLGTSMEDLHDRDRASESGAAGPSATSPGPPPPPMSMPGLPSSFPNSWQASPPPVAMAPNPIPPAPAQSAPLMNVMHSTQVPMTSPLGTSPQPSRMVIPPQPGWSREGPSALLAPQQAMEDNRTIMRPYSSGSHRAASNGHRADGLRPSAVTLGDGRQFDLAQRVIIGRDPAARAEDVGAALVRVDDGGVSKSHLVIGRSGDDVWLEDRQSMNGTMILDSAGQSVKVPPAQRTIVSIPATVLIGDQRLFITWR